MDDFTLYTVFGKPYSAGKIAEAQAVAIAAICGACLDCEHRIECESNEKFIFPREAWCMAEKVKILEGMR